MSRTALISKRECRRKSADLVAKVQLKIGSQIQTPLRIFLL